MESATRVARRVDRDHAQKLLTSILTPGKEVFALVTHWNNTNTAASVVLLTVYKDGTGHHEIFNMSIYVARLMENSYDTENHGVRMFGGQLDLGHHAVDWLSRHLFGEGNMLKYRRL